MSKLAILFILCMSMNSALAKDKVVATVNGKEIHLEQLKDYYKKNLLTSQSRIITMESSLQELINRELGIEKAKKNKLAEDPIVAKKIDDLLFHAQTSKDLGGSFKKIPRISDDQVKTYYKKNKEYRTSHILFRLKAFPSPEEVKTAFDQAIKLVNQLKDKPEKFDSFAQQYSQSSSANSGGDLGYHPPNGYSPKFYEEINGKEVGQIVGPFRSQYGVHIAKITGIKKFNEINIKSYKKILYDQKRDKIIADYFRSLRDNAKVKINKQFLK